jgi:hypothetical protein
MNTDGDPPSGRWPSARRRLRQQRIEGRREGRGLTVFLLTRISFRISKRRKEFEFGWLSAVLRTTVDSTSEVNGRSPGTRTP